MSDNQVLNNLVKEWKETKSIETLNNIFSLGFVKKTITKVVGKYVHNGVDFEDLQQEALIGLLQGLKNYDPSHPSACSVMSYCYFWIERNVSQAVMKERKNAAQVPLEEELVDGSYNDEETLVYKLMPYLTIEENQVLCLKVYSGCSDTKVSKALFLSKKEVDLIKYNLEEKIGYLSQQGLL